MKNTKTIAFALAIAALAMATPVKADLVWDVTGSLTPGSSISATLTATTGSKSTGLSIGILRALNSSGSANGAFTASSINADFDAIGVFNGFSPSDATAAGLTGSYAVNERIYLVGTNGSTTGILGTILSFDYTIDLSAKSGDVITFDAFAGEFGSGNTIALETSSVVMPTLTMNVIPEPMTIGLLGLGGMLIARKRKVS